jgi:hypothetical protein
MKVINTGNELMPRFINSKLLSLVMVFFTPVLAYAASGGDTTSDTSSEIKFAMHRIGTFRSEACGVGDFNNDGKLDVVAGPYVYLAPDWIS